MTTWKYIAMVVETVIAASLIVWLIRWAKRKDRE